MIINKNTEYYPNFHDYFLESFVYNESLHSLSFKMNYDVTNYKKKFAFSYVYSFEFYCNDAWGVSPYVSCFFIQSANKEILKNKLKKEYGQYYDKKIDKATEYVFEFSSGNKLVVLADELVVDDV